MKNKFHHRDTENTEESLRMSASHNKYQANTPKYFCLSLCLSASVVKGLK